MGQHMDTFDVIVIGTGTAGQTAAFDLVAQGFQVAIIENSATPGGTCALRGCQAKKWFYEVAELVARCDHLQGMGVTAPPQIDWQQILAQKNGYTSKVPQRTRKNLKEKGITYIDGTAAFVDKTTVKVGEKHLGAAYFVIATGAKTMPLPFDGNELMITSDEFLALQALPRRIAFVGGGFISFEFAHYAARLGSSKGSVYILEAAERALGPFDGDMVEQLVAASEADGIQIRTKVKITAIEKNEAQYTVVCEGEQRLDVDLVVNGAGRVPNIDALNLDAAGVSYSKRGISVDKYMQSSNEQIFAAGDCVDSVQLARVADAEAHVAAQAIMVAHHGGTRKVMDYRSNPAVLFTCPQLGMVGKTEEQLKKEKSSYRRSYATQVNWSTYQRVGLHYAAYKILVDDQDHIVGAHIISDNSTGMLNTFKQAMIDNTSIIDLHKNSILSPYPSRESDIIYMLDPLLKS